MEWVWLDVVDLSYSLEASWRPAGVAKRLQWKSVGPLPAGTCEPHHHSLGEDGARLWMYTKRGTSYTNYQLLLTEMYYVFAVLWYSTIEV